jgi:hypothetical protein
MERMTWRYLIIVLVMMTRLGPAAVAEEVTIQRLTNQAGDEGVAAKCQKNQAQMRCQFVKVLIRKDVKEKPSEEEKAKKFDEYKSQIDTFSKDEICKLKNISKSEIEKSIYNQQKDLKYKWPRPVIDKIVSSQYKWANAALTRCHEPSEKNLRAYIDAEFDLIESISSTSCLIETNVYEEQFTLQPNNQWISQNGPHGRCGFITISALGKPNALTGFETYTTRRISTGNDQECKTFEQSEILSVWKAHGEYIGCEFIRLQPLASPPWEADTIRR